MPNSKRYRLALLLLWVAGLLIANPIWHALDHIMEDHTEERDEDVSGSSWSAEAHCLLCNAVTPLVETPVSAVEPVSVYHVSIVRITENSCIDCHLSRSFQLRAPPVLS